MGHEPPALPPGVHPGGDRPRAPLPRAPSGQKTARANRERTLPKGSQGDQASSDHYLPIGIDCDHCSNLSVRGAAGEAGRAVLGPSPAASEPRTRCGRKPGPKQAAGRGGRAARLRGLGGQGQGSSGAAGARRGRPAGPSLRLRPPRFTSWGMGGGAPPDRWPRVCLLRLACWAGRRRGAQTGSPPRAPSSPGPRPRCRLEAAPGPRPSPPRLRAAPLPGPAPRSAHGARRGRPAPALPPALSAARARVSGVPPAPRYAGRRRIVSSEEVAEPRLGRPWNGRRAFLAHRRHLVAEAQQRTRPARGGALEPAGRGSLRLPSAV